jgi:hypothetical protein
MMEMQDELLWSATWLYKATTKPMYLKYIKEEATSAAVAEFSWDLKYAGAQVLLSKVRIISLSFPLKMVTDFTQIWFVN